MNEDHNDNDNDNDSDDNDNDDDNITVKEINNNFKKIDETKSFEEQIDILKKNTMVTGICSIMKIIKKQILDYLN